MKETNEKILVIRYRFIGDTILTIPFLRNLRRAEPMAYIAWMVAPGSSDLVKNIPYVDEMIYWDPVTIHADSKGTHRTVSSKFDFVKNLRAQRFTKVYVLKRSLSSALLAFLTGASKRVGFDTEGRGFLLTTKVPYRNDIHEVQNFLSVLKADAVPVLDDYLELWTDPEQDAKVSRMLIDAGIGGIERVIAIHPFSAVVERGWPLEYFGKLAVQVAGLGYYPVILGGPKDYEEFRKASHFFPKNTVSLVGKISIQETASLLKKVALFVGNDSGIMHVAAAAGASLVAIFGPQNPVKFGPWSDKARVIYKKFHCSPCRQKFFTECKPSARQKPECVEAIAVEEVFQAVVSFLRQ
jgi:heptosyltransferase II